MQRGGQANVPPYAFERVVFGGATEKTRPCGHAAQICLAFTAGNYHGILPPPDRTYG